MQLAVAPRDAVHLRPNLLHHTNELVADGRALRVIDLTAVIPEVRAADARHHDADDGVGGRSDHGVGPLRNLDRMGSAKIAARIVFSQVSLLAD
jgi:hypothetical protein